MDYVEAYQKLKQCGQLHVLDFYEKLKEPERKTLLAQIASTDFGVLQYCKNNTTNVKGKITPLAAMQLEEIEQKKKEYTAVGLETIKAGKVASVLLAGGMGTRLGSDSPKGMFNIGLTRPVYIFQRIVENLLDVVRISETWIHLFIMTSDRNHETTVQFFEDHAYFGYKKDYISFFIQDMAPASDFEGKVYMEDRGKICTSPNGNGGWYVSMYKWGLFDLVKKEGIEWLNVFAVDNVLQRMADPCFIGAVMENHCAAGAKVVKKKTPDERVGALCLEDGRPSIVEYYELTDEMKMAKNENGEPAYNFGVILNYLFRESDLRNIMECSLPLHIVKKKIEHIDADGRMIVPEEPNGYKYETLVLDMIHQVDNCLSFEVEREKEFAPIKNATGVDSVDTARKLCLQNGIQL